MGSMLVIHSLTPFGDSSLEISSSKVSYQRVMCPSRQATVTVMSPLRQPGGSSTDGR
ncbi:hypothetical protein FRACA_280023 [Frankia canadensis]|uniref:Uncharacterized protein n=1 Tax=Frankia canadensis TaxID=1836972 RepID=A0A2I2KT06_9ACTN|nr:hypothetical protein FRACA_280023 [Frankia canadensis]SOU56091.1 hypothetical protein FRACA_280023 [Frankia canadensis]